VNEPVKGDITEIPEENFDDWDGYVFDTDFFEEATAYGEGGVGIFRIQRVNDATVRYLHIYNIHNGYYGHGFDFQQGDEVFQSGTL